LADNKQNEQAIDVLSRAHSPEQPDWRILNVLGTIYDTQGRFDEAQRHYSQALKIQPNDSGVLTNLGLSHALAGKLPQGESLLRQAFALNAQDNRIRTNLALIIAMQGRREEAETIARSNLPTQEGETNVANLRNLLPTTPKPVKYQ
jgi:Flp pilus assembly protein TadD